MHVIIVIYCSLLLLRTWTNEIIKTTTWPQGFRKNSLVLAMVGLRVSPGPNTIFKEEAEVASIHVGL